MAEIDRKIIKRIAGLLRHAKDQGRASAFLIGAGASITAEIPTAKELVAEIKERHGHLIDDLDPTDAQNYGVCMHRLTRIEREDLIKPYLDNAKLNWGHIALAQLIATGYVNRVLSFNFDLVLEKAAALLGLQVPVYDFGAAPSGDVSRIARPAIIHLHGQSFGFVMLNSREETERHREALKPLFRDTLHRQQLFVIGYSGAADASLKTIEDEVYEERIVWLGYPPSMDTSLTTLMTKPYCEYAGNADFDRTMIAIAQELNCWPPQIVNNPMTHLIAELKPVVKYPITSSRGLDLLADLKTKLEAAESKWETDKGGAEAVVSEAFKSPEARDPQARGVKQSDESELSRGASAWLLIEEGNELATQAKTEAGNAADALFEASAQKYIAALTLKPNMYEALDSWGLMHLAHAQMKTGKERKQLLELAIKKLGEAVQVDPTEGYNYACALSLAGRKEEALSNLEQAFKSGTFPPRHFVESDKDLDPLRKELRFLKLFEKLKS